ncbi:VOC family protein, partial [Neisseria oralis]
LQHISFATTPERFTEMQARLKRNGIEIVFGPQVVLPPNIQSVYFYDPNGIRLEISADMSGADDNLDVVRSVLMDKATMRAELAKIS